jgi:hypothetical protein
MKRFWCLQLLSVMLLWAVQPLRAQEQTAQITSVELTSENEVLITYNLVGDPKADYEVEVILLSEKDPDFELELKTLSGDVGKGKFAGEGRRVRWNVAADFPHAMTGEKYKFKLVVSRVTGGGIPWYVYAGGSVLVGGLAVLLTSKKEEPPPAPERTIPFPPER